MLVRISHYAADSGEARNFLRRALRIAPGDNDLALGILAANAANGGSRVPVGRGGHCAGIQHYNLGRICVLGAVQAALAKLSLDRSPVGLGSPATEIFDVEGTHHYMVTHRYPFPWRDKIQE